MIPDTVIHNVVAASAQLVVVVTLAALLQWIVRIDAAGVRYAYWRAVAAFCLVLPWIQSYRQPIELAESVAAGPAQSVAAVVTAAAVAPIVQTNWAAFAALAIAAGAVARLLWIAAGLVRLRRLRAEAAPADTSALVSDLQATLGTRAEVRYVARLQHPVTFGVRRPVVLLPDALRAQPVEIQRAVLAHELLHVQRRDWGWLVGEEIVRAVLWCQPAAWWLISRIQLAREEVVDDMAVMVTGRRKVYVEALLAFSDPTSLAPTAAFARRRHLFRRIGLVSREVDMSSRRIVVSCAAMAAVIAVGSVYAVSAFPLEQATQVLSTAPAKAAGPLEQRANPITPENPIPRRLNSQEMLYPAEAAALQASGRITFQVTLDELGRVAEARLLSFSITSPGPGTAAESKQVSDAVQRAATDAVKQWRYDPPFKAPISFPVTFRFGEEPPPVETARQVSPEGRAPTDGTLRVGELGASPPMKVRHVAPVYPAIARAANVQGVVIMEARVEPDGSVSEAKIIKSIPLLDQAALDAVKQWRFKPTLLNGQPVAVMMTLTINFALGENPVSLERQEQASNDKAGPEPYLSPDRSKVVYVGSGKPVR